MFRAELLSGYRIVTAGRRFGSLGALGAEVVEFGSGLDEEAALAWAARHAPLSALVCDARDRFAADGLQPALAWTWWAVRAVAVGALIPGQLGGKIVLIAPAPDAGGHAEAARAGLENLARTLSVEWARYRITVTAVAPGLRTTDEEVSQLVGFVASRGGDYLSGCRFDLR